MNSDLLKQLSTVTQEEEGLLRGGDLDRSLYTDSGDFVISSDRLSPHSLSAPASRIALRTHTRFVEFPLHGHRFVEIMYVLSGQITHIIGAQSLTLRQGDLLLLNTHVRHRILPARREDVAVNLILPTDYFATFLDTLKTSEALSDFILENLKQNGQSRYLQYAIGDILPLSNLMDNLVYSLITDHDGSFHTPQTVFGQTLSLLLTYLTLYPDSLRMRSPLLSKNEQMLSRISAYIETGYATASLTDLAKIMGFSPQYLSEWITAHTGTTFKAMLQEKRFAVAEQLLRTTSLPISDIMTAVGYENSSYFHRSFRIRYGTTPLIYRSQNRFTANPTDLKGELT